jgi:two-component system, NtrC family, nitrogen regulation sensor histidine kinase NtrY
MLKKGNSWWPIALILLSIGLILPFFSVYNLTDAAKQAQTRLFKKTEKLNLLKSTYLNDKKDKRLLTAFETDFTALFVLKNDSLTFWSTSRIPIGIQKLKKLPGEGLIQLRNGYYYYQTTKENDIQLTGFIFIKPNYDLQNNYLNNQFCEWLELPKEIEIDTKLSNTNTIITSATQKPLFSLSSDTDTFYRTTELQISLVFILLGLAVFLIFIIRKTALLSPIQFWACWLSIIAVYIAGVYFRLPHFLYQLELFDIRRFANADSFLNAYLGHILFNSLLLLAFSVAWYKHLRHNQSGVHFKLSITILMIVGSVIWLNLLLKSLIANSTLSFDFLNLYNTNWLSYVGISSLVFINLSICVFCLSSLHLNKSMLFLIVLAIGLPITLYFHSASSGIEIWWSSGLIVFILAFKWFNMPMNALSIGAILLYLSVCNSSILSRYIDDNEAKNLEVLSFQLTERQDPILESEFAGLPKSIQTDEKLKNLISILPISQAETPALIKQKYFSGYFEHYNIDLALFDKNCNPLLPFINAVHSNEGFFTDQIAYQSQTPINEHLFFIDGYKQHTRYVSQIPMGDYKLFILLEPKQFEEIGSFPDLLLDQSQQKQAKLKAFSYAVYRNKQLTNRYGNFNYPYLKPDSSLLKSQTEYVHTLYETDQDTEVIITSPVKDWSFLFTYNSYVFLFFSILTFLAYLVYSLTFKSVTSGISLTQRIQFIIIFLLLLAIGSIAISSTRLIQKQFANDNTNILQEKSQSVVNDVLPVLQSDKELRDEQKELVNLNFRRNARLFSCDISLYDTRGKLFTTTQPRLYELGLASELANPEALNSLKSGASANFCATDKAGSLQFLSLYTPLYSSQNQLLGYLNLPYFAKQSELVNRLSSIISTLINLYVILFVLSILSALVLSGYITKPLRLIKQQIANISLSKHNERIQWQSNDEIGKLVNEYNGMISKLEESAGLLAKSERETAWREMAKQVAHEIKNPLTPMKLNLQYLQHVINSNPDDFKEKFERASNSIIEQIDTLANIATEFSHFAKLPSAKIETIDLIEVLLSSIETFTTEPNVQFQNGILEKELLVRADKEQALRIFNNIIKNAIQACEDRALAEIKLAYYTEDNNIIISISDNGCGIDEHLREKLFTPNFTTKSTGSGLGLAMVKNSMESFGGKVWYESEDGKGSTFYLQFTEA